MMSKGRCCGLRFKLQGSCSGTGCTLAIDGSGHQKIKVIYAEESCMDVILLLPRHTVCKGEGSFTSSLLSLDDEEVLTDACRALSYLSESSNGPSDQIQGWIEACVWQKFVNLLLIPALQIVGVIVTGDDFQNQAVLDAHIIKPIVQLLQHAEFDIKKKAARAISEATSRRSHAQIEFLVTQGCIKLLCDLLICPERSILCLQGLENILKVGEADKNIGINRFAGRVDRFGGLQNIENLQKHKNNEIHEMAVKILERYWDDKPKVPPDG